MQLQQLGGLRPNVEGFELCHQLLCMTRGQSFAVNCPVRCLLCQPNHPHTLCRLTEDTAPLQALRRQGLVGFQPMRLFCPALLYGFRLSVLFALALTLFGTVIGVLTGALQGFFGGKTDLAMQRFIEVWSAMPE